VGSDIQLISDGDGLAVIGDPAAVELFLTSEGLVSRDLGLPRLRSVASVASGVARGASEITANSGRWVQLTQASAELAKKYPMVVNSATGLNTGALRGDNGQFVALLQFTKDNGAFLANPAVLAGAAGLMAQLAMKQSMDEITDYLATIDEKVDDVLRAQKDAVLADMIGVGFVIDDAIITREHTGRVSEVTWSKVQGTPITIARTQAYVLRQLDALAEKMERKSNVGDLAKTTRDAESKVQEWLAVLARCFQLQDAISLLELDRVLDVSPEDLNQHRMALKAARQKRLELIAENTARLIERMDAAAGVANSKVLLHPNFSRAVVHSSNHVATSVVDFRGRLGIEESRDSLEARRWLVAVTDARDDVLETGAEGVEAAKRLGTETFDRARGISDRVTIKLAERALRRRGAEADPALGDDAQAPRE
jgi:hypothetical protein